MKRLLILAIFCLTFFSASPVLAVSPLLTSINAYWKFDESSGNALDATGNGTTLSNNNTITYVAGLIGNAASLNGSTQFFNVGSTSFLTITQDFTIAVWVNPNFSPTQSDQYVIANKELSYGLRYERNKTGDGAQSGIDFMLNTTGSNAAIEVSTPAINGDYLSQNVWHLIVFTRTQSTGVDIIYVDGVNVRQQTDSPGTAITSNSNGYQMGQNAMTFTNGGYFVNQFWSGKFDATGLQA